MYKVRRHIIWGVFFAYFLRYHTDRPGEGNIKTCGVFCFFCFSKKKKHTKTSLFLGYLGKKPPFQRKEKKALSFNLILYLYRFCLEKDFVIAWVNL